MNLAIGFFDGVHLGHRRVLASAEAALTFRNHPLSVLDPARAPRLLMTTKARLAAIADALSAASDAVMRAVPRVRALEFTAELAAEPPEAFADFLCREYPNLECVWCGPNWTFGARGAGTPDFLRARGFEVRVADFVHWQGLPISSTRIRSALANGDLAAANAMLGRPYAVEGTIGKGKGLAHELGFPTLNLVDLQLPDFPFGVYAVSTPYGRGLANWGLAPTMGEAAWKAPVLEIHLLEVPPSFAFDAETTPRMAVSFLSFLRPERRFASIAELQSQIARDITCATTQV